MKFALAGNPNCGKTTLFNALTGSSAHVGNWPGVTIDKREGTYKKGAEKAEIVDLPGIYSLSPYTPEEIVSRNFIIDEKPDLVLNIVDATNLERNLYLTTQIMEIDVPIVIALNMMDVVNQTGGKINAKMISDVLGVPVVEISALRSKGIDELMRVAIETAAKPRKATTVMSNAAVGKAAIELADKMAERGVESPLFHAIKLIENDEIEVKEHETLVPLANSLKKQIPDNGFGGDMEALIADARYGFLSSKFEHVQERKELNKNLTKSDKIDKVFTHRIWGIPIFLAMMLIVFHLTFSGDFLFLSAVIPEGSFDIPIIGTDCINSPGVMLQEAMIYLTDDLIGANMSAAFETAGASYQWIGGLICDGLWTGVATVLSFIPQIMLLFLFLFIMEDSGYMARVAFIMDRAFRKIGLSGKAFMPLLMCFGCAVPGMMATRTLESEKERRLTIMLAPFFSCGAKAPIWVAIATVINSQQTDLVVFGIYVLGIAVAVLAAYILTHTLLKGDTPPFIMELPAYHSPRARNVGTQLWEKFKHYIFRAATIIAASVVVIWFLSSFNFWDGYIGDDIEHSLLGYVGKGLSYLFYPLGFGMGDNGWAFTVAVFTGLIAKEMVVSTLGTLAGMSGDALDMTGSELRESEFGAFVGSAGVPALVAFMAFNLLAVPCMAAVGAARGEFAEGKQKVKHKKGEPRKMRESTKKLWTAIAFWFITAYVVSFVIYWIGAHWWTVFIFAALLAIGIALIELYRRGRLGNRSAKLAVAGGAPTELSATNIFAAETVATETVATERATETIATETVAAESAVTETIAAETAVTERATETSATQTSAAESAVTETSAAESATETSAAETSATEKVSTAKPTAKTAAKKSSAKTTTATSTTKSGAAKSSAKTTAKTTAKPKNPPKGEA